MFVQNPLVNEGAGRFKSDPVNQARIEHVINTYRALHKEKFDQLQSQLLVNEKIVSNSRTVFPVVGALVGFIGSQAFVHANSKYIGKFLIAATTYGGYWLYKKYKQSYNTHKYFTHYQYYPTEIQQMIDNNDARYAHKWLNVNPNDAK